MPSKTSLYFPRPSPECVSIPSRHYCEEHVLRLTYLPYDLIVLKYTPADIDRVVIPVRSRHLLIDIGINARHPRCLRRTCAGQIFRFRVTAGIGREVGVNDGGNDRGKMVDSKAHMM